MLNKIVLAAGIMVLSILLLAGCASGGALTSSNEIKVSLGQEFTLPIGKTAVVTGENISFKFESVAADSRCPTGVQCVWAGEAKCQMQAFYSGNSPAAFVLTETGGTDGFSQGTFANYQIAFQLQPYPEAGKQINAGDYKLTMKITK